MSFAAGVVSLIISFTITALLGIFFVPYFKKIKFGQTVKEIGPVWHKNKTGTPTMGGVMFIIGITLGTIVGFVMVLSSSDIRVKTTDFFYQNIGLWSGLIAAFGYGIIGFIDDYIKVFKKRNLGLTSMQKTVAQLVVTIAYIMTLHLSGKLSTIVDIPFIGQFDFSVWFYPIAVVGIYFFVNAVNLTDGIDGLAASVTTIYAIIFMFISSALFEFQMNVFAAAITGGCLGFLVWNFYPAKIFMGDTGSMFLGGCVVALGFSIGQPFLILIAGIIYLIEALSVVIQVISFKLTGKRVFKMSPIHHHFEMCGYSEIKIVTLFSLITAIFGVIGILSIIYGII